MARPNVRDVRDKIAYSRYEPTAAQQGDRDRAGAAYTRRSGFEVYGRDGRKLTEHWSSGPRTLHGFYSHGFPNCFHLGITQNTFTPNFLHVLDEQSRDFSCDRGRSQGRGRLKAAPGQPRWHVNHASRG
jgi:hypothetical protein